MFTAFKGFTGIVPGWVWALICAAAVAWGGVQSVRGAAARSAAQVAAAERNAFSAELEATRRKVDAQKAEAAKLLADETAKVGAAETRTIALKQELEAARGKAQSANRDAVAARAAGQRLRFASETSGCRGSGDSAKAAPDSPASDAGPAYVELPDQINRDLLGLAGDAESLAIDYRVLYEWANTPGMVCTMQ